jgi:glutaredoxin
MSVPHDDSPSGPVGPDRKQVGFLLTVVGFLVALAWVLDRVAPLPFPLPRLWFLHRNLLGIAGVAAALTGLALQRDHTLRGPGSGAAPPDGWTPRIPGRRFESLVVYTRPGCHLCDDALELLADYSPWLPTPEEIDIDPHPALKARHGEWIPVVEIDGRERFRGRIDEPLLRRLIDNTPPLDQIPPGPRFRPESNS